MILGGASTLFNSINISSLSIYPFDGFRPCIQIDTARCSALASGFLFCVKIFAQAITLSRESCIVFILCHRGWREQFNAAGHVSTLVLVAAELSLAHALATRLVARAIVCALLLAGEVEEDLPAEGREGLHDASPSFCTGAEVRNPAKGSSSLILAPLLYDGFVEEASIFRLG